jgi:hypothetical protein
MNKALLQDNQCLVIVSVPESAALLFFRCGFTKLAKHQEKKQILTILGTKPDHMELVWQKNMPMTKPLTEIVNEQIEKSCKEATRRFKEETVQANKRAFEEIFSNSSALLKRHLQITQTQKEDQLAKQVRRETAI